MFYKNFAERSAPYWFSRLPILILLLVIVVELPAFARSPRPLTKCGILDRNNENYILQNDVSAPGTCFSVQANGVTLDLNGHTITYGTCEGNACGWSLANITSVRRINKKVYVEFQGTLPNLQKPWLKLSGTANPSFEGYFRVTERPSSQVIAYQQSGPDAATSGGKVFVSLRRHAILAQQCYDPENDGNPCGANFSGFTVRNGKIVQGPGVGPYSDAIRFGQDRWSQATIQDLEITIGAPSTKAILLTYGAGGHKILNNIIHNGVKEIINRHQIDGATIRISNEKNPAPSEITANVIIGSAQGGIANWSSGSVISKNKISLDAFYTNDFCIYAYGAKQRVYENTCDNSNGSGRGFHVGAPEIEIFKNLITVREKSRNAEYKGCESGGAYGIQVEGDGAARLSIHDNDVTAIADDCDASGFRATNIKADAQNRIYSNTFKAVRVGGSKRMAAGMSGNEVDGGLLFENNTFISDGAFVAVPWGGISDVEWLRDTIRVGKNPGPQDWYLFHFSNSGRSTGLRLVDPRFENGASPRSKGLKLGLEKWGGPLEFSIETTFPIRVLTPAGTALPNTKVVVTNDKGAEVCSTTTSVDGTAVCSLPQARYYNTSDEPLVSEKSGPFTAFAKAADGRSSTKRLVLNGRAENVVTLK